MTNFLSVEAPPGRVYTLQPNNEGPFKATVATAAGGGATLTNLSNLLVIDHDTTVALADQIGNLEAPFATVQQGIDAAVAVGNPTPALYVAPSSTYGEPIVVPDSIVALTLQGMAKDSRLDGAITFATNTKVHLDSLSLYGSLTYLALGDSKLDAVNCDIRGAINGDSLIVDLQNTSVHNDLTAVSSLVLTMDDYSYTTLLYNGVSPLPATYTRRMRGFGPRRIPSTISTTGLAIGATRLVTINLSATDDIRDLDSCVISRNDGVGDFIVSFQYIVTGGNSIVVAITNLSRGSTNFNDPINIMHLCCPFV